MSSSVAISSVSLPTVVPISSTAAQQLASNTLVAATIGANSASSIVELSASGQLASTLSATGDLLNSLLTDLTGTDAANLGASAQSLVDILNNLQGTVQNGQPGIQLLPDLNALLVTNGGAAGANLSALASIGITAQPAAAGTTLVIDQTAFDAAVATDATAVQAALVQAGQDLLAGTSAATALLVASATTPPALAQVVTQAPNTTTTAALNDIVLTGLGLNAATTLPDNAALENLLNPTFAAAVTTAAQLTGALSPTGTPTAAATANQALTPATTTGVTTATLPTATQNLPATSTANGTATVAGNAAAVAAAPTTTQFQEDPTLRAIKNVIDPFYAAIIAANHLSDFAYPSPRDHPGALNRDLPGAVARTARAPQVTYSGEQAGGELRHETTHAA